MYLVVITVLDKFSAVISAIPAFVEMVTSFKALTANIKEMSQDADEGTSGKTKVKQTAASIMAETVAALVGVLHAYACKQEDQDLMEQTDIAETNIIRERDAKRADYCKKLVNLVEKYKGDLVNSGITDADFTEARQSIKDYETSLSTKNSTKTTQEGEHESIDEMIAKADRMLFRQMDRMVKKQKKAHPDFFAEYSAARVVIDIAATRKGKNLPKGQAPTPPTGGGTQSSK
jgi:hypothetical protein